MSDLPPNHHADDNGKFSGPFGYLAALTMVAGRGGDARVVTKMAGVSASDHVLDIGCGPGTAARHAARTGARVTAIDPGQPMLNLAKLVTRVRPPAGAIDWVNAGCEDIPLPDGSVSVCWSLASVHHWPDLEPGLVEVARVLEPGGRFIALEKKTPEGASGLASHGWTPQQAEAFASMLPPFGFTAAAVETHDLGRRTVLTVSARTVSA